MTRAEFFVTRGRGHWAKCRRAFRCNCDGQFGPCLNPISPGDVYLATDLPSHPDAQPGSPRYFMKRRYCAHSAGQQIVTQAVAA